MPGQDSASSRIAVDPDAPAGDPAPEQVTALEGGDPSALVRAGVLHPEPIVYEDFLPRSAAGIFASNLTDERNDGRGPGRGRARRRTGWRASWAEPVHVPEEIYAQEASASLGAAEQILGRRISATATPDTKQPQGRHGA